MRRPFAFFGASLRGSRIGSHCSNAATFQFWNGNALAPLPMQPQQTAEINQ
jgi:hypothetical protein